jgi:hypothetical protein
MVRCQCANVVTFHAALYNPLTKEVWIVMELMTTSILDLVSDGKAGLWTALQLALGWREKVSRQKKDSDKCRSQHRHKK